MSTRTAAADPIALPRLGRGPAAEGRRLALRAFHDQVLTLDGDMLATLTAVEAGNAPQEFKDAFRDTLRDLSNLFARAENT